MSQAGPSNQECRLYSLFCAIFENKPAEVERLITAGVDVNSTVKDINPIELNFSVLGLILFAQPETTPLHWAAIHGNESIVRALLNAGADASINAVVNLSIETASTINNHIRIFRELFNNIDTNAPVAELEELEDRIIDIDDMWTELWRRENPHINTNMDLGALYDSMFDGLNSKGILGTSPLSLAINNGHHNIVKLLLSSGADPNSTNALGTTMLELAVAKGNINTVNALLEIPSIMETITTNPGGTQNWLSKFTHLNPAITHRLIEVPTIMATITADNNNRILCAAARNGHLNVLNRLLEIPTVLAAIESSEYSYALCAAARGGHINVVNRLLQIPAVCTQLRNNSQQLHFVFRLVFDTIEKNIFKKAFNKVNKVSSTKGSLYLQHCLDAVRILSILAHESKIDLTKYLDEHQMKGYRSLLATIKYRDLAQRHPLRDQISIKVDLTAITDSYIEPVRFSASPSCSSSDSSNRSHGASYEEPNAKRPRRG